MELYTEIHWAIKELKMISKNKTPFLITIFFCKERIMNLGDFPFLFKVSLVTLARSNLLVWALQAFKSFYIIHNSFNLNL